MNTFWELFKQSVIVQATITLILTIVLGYMFVTKTPIPDTLLSLYGVVIGYYFGSKTQAYLSRM